MLEKDLFGLVNIYLFGIFERKKNKEDGCLNDKGESEQKRVFYW